MASACPEAGLDDLTTSACFSAGDCWAIVASTPTPPTGPPRPTAHDVKTTIARRLRRWCRLRVMSERPCSCCQSWCEEDGGTRVPPLSRRLRAPQSSAKTTMATLSFLLIFLSLWRSEEHTSELQSQSNLVCR